MRPEKYYLPGLLFKYCLGGLMDMFKKSYLKTSFLLLASKHI